MTLEEKQRMIHIRINNAVHKELRKVAAEYDLTIQEIVSNAVEEKVEALETQVRLEREQVKLERKAHELETMIMERIEPLQIEIEQEFAAEAPNYTESSADKVSVMERLETIEREIETLVGEISKIHQLIDQCE